MRLRSKLNNNLFILGIVLLLGSGMVFSFRLLNNQFSANALSARDFNPGRIIDDSVFYNKDAMSIDQIQTFLNNLLPVCHTWNNQKFVDAGGNLVGAPYVCLNNYHENPETGETSFEKGGGAFPGGHSAARIIYDAGQKYGINPQVLLVMLKKESLGPITADTWPTKWQYRYSMGYGCPDSGPNYTANCNEKQAGFYKQVNLAAWQFKYYKDHPNDYRYKLGWNDIQYSPNPECGTKRVFIENIATLSLYIYTPYVPNDGALANYPGRTSHCGAYGNRNFFMFFNEWFGSTKANLEFVSLDNPRWMRMKDTGYKTNLLTGELATDNRLSKNQQIRFVDKYFYNNEWHLRTEFDSNVNNILGIPFSDLEEIPFENLDNPIWKTLSSGGNKSHPSSRQYAEPLEAGLAAKFTQKIDINGNIYYRTEHDTIYNNELGVISTQLSDFTFIPVETETYMYASEDTLKVALPDNNIKNSLAKDTSLKISGKVLINGVWYFQEYEDFKDGNRLGVDSNSISRNEAIKLAEDIIISIPSNNIKKYDLHTLTKVNTALKESQKIVVTHSIKVNNDIYLLTKYDYDNNNYQGIKVSELFVPLEVKREFEVINSTNKINMHELSKGDFIEKNRKIYFSTKIFINNRWFLRTAHDTGLDNLLCIDILNLK